MNTIILSFLFWDTSFREPKRKDQCLTLAQNFENLRLNDNGYQEGNIGHLSLFMKNYLHCISGR